MYKFHTQNEGIGIVGFNVPQNEAFQQLLTQYITMEHDEHGSITVHTLCPQKK